jgi:pantetheine-phosphate adenylyltransferase
VQQHKRRKTAGLERKPHLFRSQAPRRRGEGEGNGARVRLERVHIGLIADVAVLLRSPFRRYDVVMVQPLFPGSFDPPTKGHLDLIERALRSFGSLCVAVAENSTKTPTFSVEERLELLTACLGERPGLEITSFDGLVVDYCHAHGYDTILRGLRTVSDLEYEYSMALTNRTLAPEVETVFLMPRLEFSFTSSSLIKEVLRNGGDVTNFLPEPVIQKLKEKL